MIVIYIKLGWRTLVAISCGKVAFSESMSSLLSHAMYKNKMSLVNMMTELCLHFRTQEDNNHKFLEKPPLKSGDSKIYFILLKNIDKSYCVTIVD
jgi:hypothetical protein